MILAFHASDRGSNPSLAIIFYLLLFLFSVCFCCFYFDLFFFFIFNHIDNLPTFAIRYKITKGSRYLYCVQKFSLFLCSHSSFLHNRAFLTPRMKLYAAKHVYRVYITFLIICFSNCLKLLYLSYTKTNC